MAIEIVDCPIKNDDFPWQNVSSPEGIESIGIYTHTNTISLFLLPSYHYFHIITITSVKL